MHRNGVWTFSPQADDIAEGTECLLVPLVPTDPDDLERRLPRSVPACAFRYDEYRRGRDPHLAGPAGYLKRPILAFYSIYLPVLLGSFFAAKEGRSFVMAHVAQTLDGKIACRNGHSKWISNQANLRHAHCLRALHDAVMVGTRTVENDDPQLTVRHVPGDHPHRVILNASASLLRTDQPYQIFTEHACTVVSSSDRSVEVSSELAKNGVHAIALDRDENRLIPPGAIVEALAERGIVSIFLEGGAQTLSRFLEKGALDLLHVHIAPMILGSGISSFSLPEAMKVQDGRQFHMMHYDMDGELLLECRSLVEGA